MATTSTPPGCEKTQAADAAGWKLSPSTVRCAPPFAFAYEGETKLTAGGDLPSWNVKDSPPSHGEASDESAVRSRVSASDAVTGSALGGVAHLALLGEMSVAGVTPSSSKTQASSGVGARL